MNFAMTIALIPAILVIVSVAGVLQLRKISSSAGREIEREEQQDVPKGTVFVPVIATFIYKGLLAGRARNRIWRSLLITPHRYSISGLAGKKLVVRGNKPGRRPRDPLGRGTTDLHRCRPEDLYSKSPRSDRCQNRPGGVTAQSSAFRECGDHTRRHGRGGDAGASALSWSDTIILGCLAEAEAEGAFAPVQVRNDVRIVKRWQAAPRAGPAAILGARRSRRVPPERRVPLLEEQHTPPWKQACSAGLWCRKIGPSLLSRRDGQIYRLYRAR